MNDIWVGKSILIADDSELIRGQLSGLYADVGLRVISMARNGSEAMDIYHAEKPDVVSFDILMPEMHGVECCQKLVAINPDLKFLFVSCLAAEMGISESAEGRYQAEQLINKPATREDIISGLRCVFGQERIQSVQADEIGEVPTAQ